MDAVALLSHGVRLSAGGVVDLQLSNIAFTSCRGRELAFVAGLGAVLEKTNDALISVEAKAHVAA